MPAGTIKVDRSTRWGNPFRAEEYQDSARSLTRELPTRAEREKWMREMAAEAIP
jgi:hypothetical protein